MTPESITIVLPLPDKVLSPNWMAGTIRGRFYKASATKRYRRLTKEAIINERIKTIPWPMVKVSVEFFYKTSRKRDEDNAMGSLKAVYDGIVDAGLVVIDNYPQMQREMPKFSIDHHCPRVILTLTRQELQ